MENWLKPLDEREEKGWDRHQQPLETMARVRQQPNGERREGTENSFEIPTRQQPEANGGPLDKPCQATGRQTSQADSGAGKRINPGIYAWFNAERDG